MGVPSPAPRTSLIVVGDSCEFRAHPKVPRTEVPREAAVDSPREQRTQTHPQLSDPDVSENSKTSLMRIRTASFPFRSFSPVTAQLCWVLYEARAYSYFPS